MGVRERLRERLRERRAWPARRSVARVRLMTGAAVALAAALMAACGSGSTAASSTPASGSPGASGAAAAAAPSGTGLGAATHGSSGEAVVRSLPSPSAWRQERLTRAVSAHGGKTATAPANQVTARVGAIFAHSGTGDHFCTGSVVQSQGQSMVVTAAHCVHGGKGGSYNTDIVFVPGYRDGVEPQGEWPIRSIVVDQRWIDSTDPDLDVAFLVLGAVDGKTIASVLGGNKLGVNAGFGRTVALTGYPANAGEPIACFNTTTQQSAFQMKISCPSFPGGTSGSPWLTGFDRHTRTGTVIGVIGGYQQGGDTPDVSYSPYFDDDVLALYNRAVAEGG
ncbi:trypsin-like serine peptidase [Streptacidiphilus anmyonensis]|uniref:trypsin-like serine peptidase n=1 Tax=Streptacidiphilus anmyonensis TaxID=405782 RepID=UPI000B21A24D|nr:trypsin-like serine protease [Streptacidiphilus anmyonensis]